jgi:uncharacterized protein (DUF2126 family)
VEPRDGRLHVFLPPVATTEAYLDLVSTLESTVSAMGVPVILEGEAPPPLSERLTAYCNRPETLQLLRDCRREWFTLEIRTSAKQALVSALAGDASI